MADNDDAYDHRKSGGWYKRRHKKDGHTYRKNTEVVDMRVAKAHRYTFRPIDTVPPATDVSNPNHRPVVHEYLDKCMQRLVERDIYDCQHLSVKPRIKKPHHTRMVYDDDDDTEIGQEEEEEKQEEQEREKNGPVAISLADFFLN